MTENNRLAYFIDIKKKTTKLVILLLIASAVIRLIFCRGIYAGRVESFMQLVLPVAGTVLLAIMLLLDGGSRCYRTSVPIIMIAGYFAFRTFGGGFDLLTGGIICLCCVIAAVAYTRMTEGKTRRWFLALMMAGVLAAMLIIYQDKFHKGNRLGLLAVVPDMLIPLSVLLIALSMQVDSGNEIIVKRWGDRSDGRRVRTVDPIVTIANYIMPTRIGSSNCITETLDIGPLEAYCREKRSAGYKGFGLMHVFLASYIRCVAKYPAINRFISGQKVYTHGDDILFCLAVKSSMSINAQESIVKIKFHPSDTIMDVYEKVNASIAEIKGENGDKNGVDKTARLMSFIPGILIKFIIWILSVMDYFGLMPGYLVDISPFHGSVFFTSMGSLGINPIVHHLYDFGNLPVFCSFGSKYTKNELDNSGNVIRKKYVDYTFNTDERIVDGFYYATVFKYFKRLMSNPAALEQAPEVINKDID